MPRYMPNAMSKGGPTPMPDFADWIEAALAGSDLRDLIDGDADGITVADTWQMAAEDAQRELKAVRADNVRLRERLKDAHMSLQAVANYSRQQMHAVQLALAGGPQ